MARRIELKGKAKTYAGVVGLVVAAWLVFGQTLFSFNFGFFNQGYQVSLLRSGHFESQGIRWDQYNRTLGRVATLGGETLVVDLEGNINRGSLVVFAWHWPAFLYGDSMVHRSRYDKGGARERLEIALPDSGLYVLSASGANLGGSVTLDWQVVPGRRP